MKPYFLIVFIMALMPYLNYSFPTYMSVLYNEGKKHSILLWGDRHPSTANNVQEAQFLDLVRPYLNALLGNKIPSCVVNAEIHGESMYNTIRQVQEGLIKAHELNFLARLSVLATQKPCNLNRSWLGIDKAQVPVNLGDNRRQAVFAYTMMCRNSLPSAAESTVDNLLDALSNDQKASNDQTFHKVQLYNTIKELKPLQVIDRICFDQQFAEELHKFNIDINDVKNSFVNNFCVYSKKLSGRDYSIHDLVAQIRLRSLYCLQKNQNSIPDSAEQNIWAEACGQLQWIEKAIITAFKPQDKPFGMPLTECMINKAGEIRSFYALSTQYELSERDEQEKNDIYYIARTLIEKYPNSNFLDQTQMAANTDKNAVCIAGSGHCREVGRWLQSLGYSPVVKYNDKAEQMLDPKNIHDAFTKFAELAHANSMQIQK